MPDLRRKETFRIVKCLGLHVLTEGERHRPAFRRVGQHTQGTRQRRQKLFGPGDPVEIAADRAESIIGADRAIRPILDLLQHWVGRPVGEHIAGDQQHRQTVHMRQRRRRHQIERTRPDRGCNRHGLAALARLGIGNGRMGHGLFIMPPPGRQTVAVSMKRLADPRDVAVAEDRPHPLDEALAVVRHLDGEPAHHGLRGGQPDGCHCASPRAASQTAQRRRKFPAISCTAAASAILPAIQPAAASAKIVRPTAKPRTSG